MDILIEKILPNPEQPRTVFDPDELEGLASTIREHGMIQPVSVEQADDGFYILHDGERRLRAAKLAGLEIIPAAICEPLNGSGPRERLERALVANLQRDDMNPIDEARGYAKMRDEHHMTVRRISDRLGVNEARIHSRLALLKADPEIQELVAAGKLSHYADLSRALMEIPDKKTRIALAERIASRKLSIKGSITAAKRIAAQMNEKKGFEKDATPALKLAWQDQIRKNIEPQRWDCLRQLGQVPPWKMIEKSAMDTCEMCVLREIASQAVCAECGLVAMLRTLIRAGGS